MPHQHNPALDTALLLIAVLERIPRRRYIDAASLHQKLEHDGFQISRRQLQRHLKTLSDTFPLECDTRSKPYGYRWAEGAEILTLPHLTPAQALLLTLASGSLTQLLPAHERHLLRPLAQSAQQQLKREGVSKPHAEWLGKIARIPECLPLRPPHLSEAILDTLSEALFHERKLLLGYRNSQGEDKTATVAPLGLVQRGQRLYLVCRFDGYDNQRILALPRIHRAELGEPFHYPDDFDLKRYIEQGHFGILRGDKVRLSFTLPKPLAAHLLESPLSDDQTVEPQGERYRIQATLNDTELLRRWLNAWGEDLHDLQLQPLTGGEPRHATPYDAPLNTLPDGISIPTQGETSDVR